MLHSNFHIPKYLHLYSKQILLKTTPQKKTNYKQIKISFWLCVLEAPVAAISFRKKYKLSSTCEKIIITKPVQQPEQLCMESLLGSRLFSYILKNGYHIWQNEESWSVNRGTSKGLLSTVFWPEINMTFDIRLVENLKSWSYFRLDSVYKS